MKMICRILLLLSLTSCVCGTLVVNVTQSSYQAEENHNITLEWTFTTTSDSSISSLIVFCELITDLSVSVLFSLFRGVEVPESQDQQFVGRVQWDKDVLREGRVRLHVSRLRTEDSGRYRCKVRINHDLRAADCWLRVTAARESPEPEESPTDQPETPSTDQPETPSTDQPETPSTDQPETPSTESPEWIGLICGLTAAAAIMVIISVVFIFLRYRHRQRLKSVTWTEVALKSPHTETGDLDLNSKDLTLDVDSCSGTREPSLFRSSPHRMKMICRILLLLSLTSCVCGTLVVNVTQSSYQAEENHNITLEWTFTTSSDSSISSLIVVCEVVNHSDSTLFHLHGGIEVPEAQHQQFAGRVQWDKDVLREGRVRLHVSRLRTEDSGQYRCKVRMNHDLSSADCWLSVTAARESPEPEESPTDQPETPSRVSRGRIGLICGLTATAVVVVVVVVVVVTVTVVSYRRRRCHRDGDSSL